MRTEEEKELIITKVGLVALFIVMVASLVKAELYPALTSVLGMALVALPRYVRLKLCMPLPWVLVALTAVVTVLHSMGILLRAYDLVWWWDILTHMMATSVIAVAANLVITVRGRMAMPSSLPIKYVPLISLGLVIVLGMLWETVEFAADVFLAQHTQYSLDDTAIDLSVDILGGALVAVLMPPYLERLDDDYGICQLNSSEE